MKVLIADDAAFMRSILKTIVDKVGYTVVAEATDGNEAVQMALEHEPDIIMMDINMPELDGLEALKMINHFNINAYIIVCSTIGNKDAIVSAIKHGADDFIVKPFNKERIMESLKKANQLKRDII